jgi:hypothetical protein
MLISIAYSSGLYGLHIKILEESEKQAISNYIHPIFELLNEIERKLHKPSK